MIAHLNCANTYEHASPNGNVLKSQEPFGLTCDNQNLQQKEMNYGYLPRYDRGYLGNDYSQRIYFLETHGIGQGRLL